MARISHFWDTGCTVADMVAQYPAGRLSDVVTAPSATTHRPLCLADHDADAARAPRWAKLSAPLSGVLTMELDGAQPGLQLTTEGVLLAALGRAIAKTIGEGAVSVTVDGAGVLTLTCALALSPAQRLGAIRYSLVTACTHPTDTAAPRRADAHFAQGARGAVDRPPRGVPLSLRAYRDSGRLQLDWWYDVDRFESSTVEELAEQFPLALIELTSETVALV